MIVVTIKGIPENITTGRLAAFLKLDLLKKKRAQFSITISGQECRVEFQSNKDAETVHNKLQAFEFMYNFNKYLLQSYINNDPTVIKTEAFENKKENNLKRNNEVTSDDLVLTDKAIELTKKKRMLIEEERKLLLEQKKLELIKSTKPTNLKDLQLLEAVCETSSMNVFKNMLNQRRRSSRNQTHIGETYKSRQKIFSQMAKIYYANVSSKENYALRKVVHTSIRNRIQELIKDKGVLTNQEVYNMYRAKYPEKDDEEFVKNLIKEGRKRIVNGSEADKPEVLNASLVRSISDMSELQQDLDMQDLDDWDQGDEMKTEQVETNPDLKESIEVKMVPVEQEI